MLLPSIHPAAGKPHADPAGAHEDAGTCPRLGQLQRSPSPWQHPAWPRTRIAAVKKIQSKRAVAELCSSQTLRVLTAAMKELPREEPGWARVGPTLVLAGYERHVRGKFLR